MNHESPYLFVLIRSSVIAALGGMLFGYDTAVISGTTTFLTDHFSLSELQLGWVASSALLGCMVGAVGGGWAGDKLGRRPTMMLCAFLFLVSAVWSGLARSPAELVLARIIGGVGVGAASLLTPVYIAEISPNKWRGSLITLNQLAILAGMIVVYIVNAKLASIGSDAWKTDTAWRWMFASESIPALLFLGLLFWIPESPRWLLGHGQTEEGIRQLERLSGREGLEERAEGILNSFHQKQAAFSEFFRPPVISTLGIGLLLAILQQATGINIVMYYAPEIFQKAGVEIAEAVGNSIFIGVCMFLCTCVAFALVDRIGRKPLLLISTGLMTATLVALGLLYQEGNEGGAGLVLVLTLGYVAAFSIGVGPIMWAVISEIFSNEVRGRAVGICVLALWLTNFVVSQTFPWMLEYLSNYSFFVYAIFGALYFVFVLLAVSETRGVSLEQTTAKRDVTA